MPQEEQKQSINQHYFADRAQAGGLLAKKLEKYRFEDTIVLALNRGSVLVGAEVARHIHSLIALLLTKDIYLPDGRTLVGIVNELGGFVFNNAFSTGEIEEFETEYRNNIEAAKMEAVHDLHIILGQGGLISPDYFRNRTVIVISDGTLNGMAFEMAYNFLKGINVKKVIMATPIAGVPAIDRMHVLADELFCLTATDSNFEVDHYYDENEIPDRDQTLAILNDIILRWKQPNSQKG
jgi:predicted phosphoribosyltransferase